MYVPHMSPRISRWLHCRGNAFSLAAMSTLSLRQMIWSLHHQPLSVVWACYCWERRILISVLLWKCGKIKWNHNIGIMRYSQKHTNWRHELDQPLCLQHVYELNNVINSSMNWLLYQAGMLMNALSHVVSATSRIEFIVGLIRGFGANMSMSARAEFATQGILSNAIESLIMM